MVGAAAVPLGPPGTGVAVGPRPLKFRTKKLTIWRACRDEYVTVMHGR